MPLSNWSSHAQLLRPVGQVLESFGMESFALKLEGAVVIVNGRKRRGQSVEELPAKGFWQLFRAVRKGEQPQERDPWETVELRYTPGDLLQLEDDARSNRGTGT